MTTPNPRVDDSPPVPAPPAVLALFAAAEELHWSGADVVQYLTESWFPSNGLDPDKPVAAYRPALPYEGLNDLAERVRNEVRGRHRTCDCPLSRLWLEDVAEVLEAATRLQKERPASPAAEATGPGAVR